MKKAFYPIVASSLALALSANVAVAEESISETIQSLSRGGGLVRETPTTPVTVPGIGNIDKTITFVDDGQNMFKPQENEADVKDLLLTFKQNQTDIANTTIAKFKAQDGAKLDAAQTIRFNGNESAGVNIGTNTLTIDFATQADFTKPTSGNYPKRNFVMDFSKTTGTYAFVGNIVVKGGNAGSLADTQFKADFNKSVKGNITLNNYTGNADKDGNNISFIGTAGLEGTLNLKNGYLKLNIADGEVNKLVLDKGSESSFTNPKLNLNITGNGKIGTLEVVNGESDITLGSAASLGFKGASTISSLTNEGSNTITAKDKLTIGKISVQEGSTTIFKTAITNQSQADRVVIKGKDATSGNGAYKLDIDVNNQKNVTAVFATTKDVAFDTKANVTNNVIRATVDLEAFKSNEDGTENASGDFTSYRLAQKNDNNDNNTETTPPPLPPISEAEYLGQETAESTISISTDLFLANFNSLNKRMGDLRDNANSHGVWARVFHGAQTNAFTVTESKSKYTTIQGGYDYGFALDNGAKNYLGFALSYGHSSLSVLDTEIGKSDLVELALYNSYIEDAGWYNDTIAKFSYLMNSINLNRTELNNFAFLFSDEFGYRFKLGSNKEWFIDPQLELSIAYINGGKLKDQSVTTDVASMMILKNRLGSSFGYEFKNEKSTLKLYVGGFYEFDYFNSGISKWSGNILGHSVSGEVKNSLNNQIDHRFVLNLGMNAEIGKNTRVYFDFEKSFVGKITTDYKFNIGARYAFGQTADKAVVDDTNKAPIKLNDSKQVE